MSCPTWWRIQRIIGNRVDGGSLTGSARERAPFAKGKSVAVPKRSQIKPGMRVQIIEKHNQRSGALTDGVVADILTNSAAHPHGIKVRLTDGKVGRVQAIVGMPPGAQG